MSRITRPAKRTHVRHRRLLPLRLDELIEQAIVDAYGPAEQAVAFHATLEQELALPFNTIVLGVMVSVRKLDVTHCGEVVAVCDRGRERLSIPLTELAIPEPPPTGWEWIEAYRRWARGASMGE